MVSTGKTAYLIFASVETIGTTVQELARDSPLCYNPGTE